MLNNNRDLLKRCRIHLGVSYGLLSRLTNVPASELVQYEQSNADPPDRSSAAFHGLLHFAHIRKQQIHNLYNSSLSPSAMTTKVICENAVERYFGGDVEEYTGGVVLPGNTHCELSLFDYEHDPNQLCLCRIEPERFRDAYASLVCEVARAAGEHNVPPMPEPLLLFMNDGMSIEWKPPVYNLGNLLIYERAVPHNT